MTFMLILTILAYLGDAFVLGTYIGMALGRLHSHYFHLANGLAAPALLLVEVLTGAWPVIPLTLTFGVMGWIGWWRTRWQTEYVTGAELAERLSHWEMRNAEIEVYRLDDEGFLEQINPDDQPEWADVMEETTCD